MLYGVGGKFRYFPTNTFVQEFSEAGFRNHLRVQHYDNDTVVGSQSDGSTLWANEGAVALAGVSGFATAIRRNSPSPWKVVVSDSYNGGTNWSDDIEVLLTDRVGMDIPMSPISLTDPFVAIERDTGRFHHTVLEVPLSQGPVTCTAAESNLRRLVYRRGYGAFAIASMTTPGADLQVIEQDQLDHSKLVLTSGPSGVTPHVIYWHMALGSVGYWWDSPTAPPQWSYLSLPAQPPGIFADAAGTVFGYSFPHPTPGFPTICRIAGGACGESALVVPPAAPAVASPNVLFAAADPGDPTAICPGSVGNRCFDTAEPFSFTSHPTIPERLFAVYQGQDPLGGVSVYFTMHAEGMGLHTWTNAVRVNAYPAAASFYYVDPEITVDHEGTILVTYSTAKDFDSGFNPQNRLAFSTDGGLSFIEISLPTWWRREDLPFHCGRAKYFLGEYHQGTVVGNRAYHLLHGSQSYRPHTVFGGFWSSRWSVVE